MRPNSGKVEPGETVEVQGMLTPYVSLLKLLNVEPIYVLDYLVMLQAMKEEPPLNAKCKDKFLIQSTNITPDKEQLPLADIVSHTSNFTPH